MNLIALDIEVYKDYFFVATKGIDNGVVNTFEMYEGVVLDTDKLRKFLKVPSFTFITFNGMNYDMPLIHLALSGYTCQQIKDMSDRIINEGLRGWQVEQTANTRFQPVNHIDLMEVAPGKSSLKLYAGRLGTPSLQNLPIDPSASISAEMREQLKSYCINDLDETVRLYRALEKQIALRVEMGKTYNIDLRSKSDAQIAEYVIRSEVEKLTDDKIYKPRVELGKVYKYTPPEYMFFVRDDLKETFTKICESEYVLSTTGKIEMPEWLTTKEIAIGNSVYRMGIGGLHSSEKQCFHRADDDYKLFDQDVASYYPSIILNSGLFPEQMGREFLSVYRSIVERRLAAKHSGDTVTADALKVTINGSFGKFGSQYSYLFAPDLLIRTTITGQLALLMLIEWLEADGISVVSANTDGIVVKCHIDKFKRLKFHTAMWETVTGYVMERVEYDAVYSRDVNNYIAIKPDGSVKGKGAFAGKSLMKNPSNIICTEAVIEYLRSGTPVYKTVHECDDITKFVTIRTVKGGAVKDGVELGKAIRWYYSHDVVGTINYASNGNKVPRSEGAKPLMSLPLIFPKDINYDWYIIEANSMLNGLGI